MGRKVPDLNGGGEFNPTAVITEEGAMLKGVITGKRDVNTTYGSKPVYSFKVLDASCRFLLDKKEVQPEEGAVVDAFAPTRLARQLATLENGATVTIVNIGKKKVGRGQPAHIFDVEVD